MENLVIDNVIIENHTGERMPVLVNHGRVCRLAMKNICANGDPGIVGKGVVG